MPPAAAPRDPLAGHVGHLTPEQAQTLETFRKEITAEDYFVPERHDDATLLRFLRARKFDLAKAKEMFINCEKWRKEFGVDNIVKNFDFKEKAEVDKYYPQFYHKMDKDGRPVYIEQLGKFDYKAVYKITTQERQLQRLVLEYEKFLNERLPACSEATGHPVETSCTILDLKGVGLTNFYNVKDYVMKASKIGQDYYPECMGKFYIINAPYLSLPSGDFYDKTLLAQIPAENLPKTLGGTSLKAKKAAAPAAPRPRRLLSHRLLNLQLPPSPWMPSALRKIVLDIDRIFVSPPCYVLISMP
ncbi:hypothetical protein RhiLY_00642 [Ceratobasidium sp. AG-Ba]|nr:hypothetical protein RhiLY_00642 [Ceratobasidium sp. AG-Ba]